MIHHYNAKNSIKIFFNKNKTPQRIYYSSTYISVVQQNFWQWWKCSKCPLSNAVVTSHWTLEMRLMWLRKWNVNFVLNLKSQRLQSKWQSLATNNYNNSKQWKMHVEIQHKTQKFESLTLNSIYVLNYLKHFRITLLDKVTWSKKIQIFSFGIKYFSKFKS